MDYKGFTLIEVIVSIAILGILAVTFIPILSKEYVSIVGTGKQSEATYLAVQEVEDRIIKKEYSKKDIEVPLKIKFDGVEKIELEVDYNYIEVNKSDGTGNKNTVIKVGIPK